MIALKLKIYQPQAHYRIPFTYQRRHTYPIPPYSTVIGFLCNVLGIRNYKNDREPCKNQNCNCDYHKLKKIKISICGTFESKTTEYIWFRNLSKESHISRFGYPQNRYVSGHIEHPGGQMPVSIDILNNVRLWIYLYHEEREFLEKIKSSIENPQKRIYPLHLGRAEDWIVIEELNFIDLKETGIGGNFKKFIWIPKETFPKNQFDFEKVEGILYKLPTFYSLKNGIRDFQYIDVKLNEGEIDASKWKIKFYIDEKENVPVFLANLGG
ncbi:type I-B CRISPR-associated protein Cas5b [Candidatus Chrysopegis kryptomonas]|uniref:CRISPR-associated protein, Cas5t family n=1 Tax=Candidatus Chryseopegocella kryptomonas TaxID=1633643 RepID=A0A0P1NYI7_9BACT|nr:type I-B CRISPR-associated protein Cas5b [Candidatus Chrysopegis kryptomonas]CUT04199.1 CRISPR-associated protein, Cas5t family [Candidatus Chrysopegis kryptomonas]